MSTSSQAQLRYDDEYIPNPPDNPFYLHGIDEKTFPRQMRKGTLTREHLESSDIHERASEERPRINHEAFQAAGYARNIESEPDGEGIEWIEATLFDAPEPHQTDLKPIPLKDGAPWLSAASSEEGGASQLVVERMFLRTRNGQLPIEQRLRASDIVYTDWYDYSGNDLKSLNAVSMKVVLAREARITDAQGERLSVNTVAAINRIFRDVYGSQGYQAPAPHH